MQIRKPLAAVGIVAGATLASSLAFAAWVADGTGSGTAGARTAVALTTSVATTTAQLFPGGNGDLLVTINNANPYPVKVTKIEPNGAITATGGCAGTNVSFSTLDDLSILVDDDDSTQATLMNAVSMIADADNNCQGAVFTVPVKLTGVSNAQ